MRLTAPLLEITRHDVNAWFGDHGTAVIGTLAIVAVTWLVIGRIVPRALRPAIARQMVGRPELETERRVETLSSVIVRTAEIILVAFAVLTILPEFGFDIRAVLAGVSITSIALGLGAQSLVRDAINGIFILSENQYARGDIVTLAGVMGTVEDVSLRRTLLRDIDGVLYTIPNGAIVVAANSTRDYSKVRVAIPVAPTTDLAKVRAVADEVGLELARDTEWGPFIREAPKYLRVDSIDMMGGVSIQVNGTVVPGKRWEIEGVLRARLLEAFQREGIKTPWG